jgi:hypothetical protein
MVDCLVLQKIEQMDGDLAEQMVCCWDDQIREKWLAAQWVDLF